MDAKNDVDGDMIVDDENEDSVNEEFMDVPDESWVTLIGHTQDVFSIAVSGDGEKLLSGAEDDTAVLWDLSAIGLTDSPQKLKIESHSDSVTNVNFNNSNSLYATADMSGKIYIHDADSGSTLYEVDYCDDLEWTCWHPTADILFAGSNAGVVYMFLLSRTQVERNKVYSGDVNAPCVSGRLLNGGQGLFAIYGDGKCLLWNLKETTCSNTLNLRSSCTSLDVHKELAIAAVGTENGLTTIVNTTNMKSVLRLGFETEKDAEDPAQNSIETIKFAPNFPWLAVGSSNGMLTIYDYETGQARHECEHDQMAVIKCLWHLIDAERLRILTACIDGAIRGWDARSGEPVLFKCGGGHEVFDFALANVRNMPLLFTACAQGAIRVYKYEENSQLAMNLQNDQEAEHADSAPDAEND